VVRIPRVAQIFCPKLPDRLWDTLNRAFDGYRGIKQPDRVADPSHHPSVKRLTIRSYKFPSAYNLLSWRAHKQLLLYSISFTHTHTHTHTHITVRSVPQHYVPALFNSTNMCPFLTKENQCVLWIISSYFSTHNSKGQDDCGRDTRERTLGWNEGGGGRGEMMKAVMKF
jgi:hypothetical protein